MNEHTTSQLDLTAVYAAGSPPPAILDARPQATPRWRAAILKADGAFLALVGGAQMIFELLSHFRGVGPLGQIFTASHYTLGFFEAHGFALLIGLLLIFVASADPKRFWHTFAVCVHMLLGGANLLFWSSFVALRLVPMGIVATVFHGLFILANLVALLRAPR
jgi:hypothetical protein